MILNSNTRRRRWTSTTNIYITTKVLRIYTYIQVYQEPCDLYEDEPHPLSDLTKQHYRFAWALVGQLKTVAQDNTCHGETIPWQIQKPVVAMVSTVAQETSITSLALVFFCFCRRNGSQFGHADSTHRLGRSLNHTAQQRQFLLPPQDPGPFRPRERNAAPSTWQQAYQSQIQEARSRLYYRCLVSAFPFVHSSAHPPKLSFL